MAMISTMKEQVYQTILKRIMNLEYLPGERLSEQSLKEELNTGRTPIREAILQLREEGLIDVVPQSGTYISKINLQTAEEARFMRESVEIRIMQQSIGNLTDYDLMHLKHLIELQKLEVDTMRNEMKFFELDEKFHHYFYIVTGREQVWLWLQMCNLQLNRFRILRLRSKNLSWHSLVTEHEHLLEAVTAGKVAETTILCTNHLHRMLNEESTLLDDYSDYFE